MFFTKAIFLVVSLVSFSAFSFSPSEYFAKNCQSCHSIGTGDSKGPDLLPVFTAKVHGQKTKVAQHSDEWLIKFFSYPEGMIKGDSSEGYAKDQHVIELFEHFNKKYMTEVQLEKAQLKLLIQYLRDTASAVGSKKLPPVKNI